MGFVGGLGMRLFLFALFTLALSNSSAGAITITYTGIASGMSNFPLSDTSSFDGMSFGDVPFRLTFVFNPSASTIDAGGTHYQSNTQTGSITGRMGDLDVVMYGFCTGAWCSPSAAYFEEVTAANGTLHVLATVDLGYHGGGFAGIALDVSSPDIPPSLFDSYSLQTGLWGGGHFLLSRGAMGGAFGFLSVQTMAVNAVPEPSTWAMLLIGFAGLGCAYCRAGKNRVRLQLSEPGGWCPRVAVVTPTI